MVTAGRRLGPFATLVMRHEGRHIAAGEDEVMAAASSTERTIEVEVFRGGTVVPLEERPAAIASELAIDLVG